MKLQGFGILGGIPHNKKSHRLNIIGNIKAFPHSKGIKVHHPASPDSPLAKLENISVRDIVNEPFILTEYGQGYRRVFDRTLAKMSLEIHPVLEIGRTDVITKMLIDSDMISFLPDLVTRDRIASGELCYLDVCDMKLDIYKQLIHHKNKWLSKSLKLFIDYVKTKEFAN